MLDSLQHRVALLDQHGIVVAVNDAWRTGGAPAGAPAGAGARVGDDYLEACARADHALVPEARQVLHGLLGLLGLLDERREELVVQCPRADGEGRWFVLHARPFVGDGPIRLVVQHREVSAERHARQELRAARDYMRAVADSMGEGLCTLDRTGAIVYVNARAEELLGWSTEDLAGLDIHGALHGCHSDGSAYPAGDCPLVAARTAGTSARSEDDVLCRRDGSLLPVRQVMTPFETEDGVGGFVLVFSDLSEQREREREDQRRLRDLGWIEKIRHALEEDRLVLHAQPIVDLATGATVQHELLLRMLDDDGATIPPGDFLPVAEAYGMIGQIDRWVIGQAMALAAEGHPVELNLSAHSLSDATLYDFVDAELVRSGARPELLVFELTETALMRDEEAAQAFVRALAARGCSLALDDFGTGYGGFSYLKRLPVGLLKIDIEFVRDLTVEIASRQVVEAVVSLARGFGIRTVAEGVEDEGTMQLLRELGVDFVQGYFTGRPAALEQTIRAQERPTP